LPEGQDISTLQLDDNDQGTERTYFTPVTDILAHSRQEKNDPDEDEDDKIEEI